MDCDKTKVKKQTRRSKSSLTTRKSTHYPTRQAIILDKAYFRSTRRKIDQVDRGAKTLMQTDMGVLRPSIRVLPGLLTMGALRDIVLTRVDSTHSSSLSESKMRTPACCSHLRLVSTSCRGTSKSCLIVSRVRDSVPSN